MRRPTPPTGAVLFGEEPVRVLEVPHGQGADQGRALLVVHDAPTAARQAGSASAQVDVFPFHDPRTIA